ncbi:AT-rich interactive domain-containing protein 3 [Linum grandiflorum]
MADPKEAQSDNVVAADTTPADGEPDLSLENVAEDEHQQPPQLPAEAKVGESSSLDAAAATAADITQPSPDIELASGDVDKPNDLHSSPPGDDKEFLQSSACVKPVDNSGWLDEDAGQFSTFQEEAADEDGSLKSKPLDECGEDNVTVGEDDKQPCLEAENKDEHRGEEVSATAKGDQLLHSEIKKELSLSKLDDEPEGHLRTPSKSFLLEPYSDEGYESGTEEEQAEFVKEVEAFYKENYLEFKPPKFYKEELNLLKLWRAVIKLGGYEQVTSCKLWRQVGESFRPPKTCTTVSWTFRIFYEKALLEYEKHKMHNGELPFSDGLPMDATRIENQSSGSLALTSGRAPRRDAAARAMQGWHSQRLLGNGEVSQPIIKDKTPSSIPKTDKPLKANGLLKRKKPSSAERGVHVSPLKTMRTQADTVVTDVGPPAEWVKINVQRTNDCYEVYALVPGLLREEVHVQSDPAGRLVISGQPEQLENPWGVTPFKKVVSLPSRIDPHQTTAVVTLHGQLFIRVPFEPSDV